MKGKTWGPSTCHQRERGQIIARVPDSHRQWSKSAPNLEKNSRPSLTNYALHEIGRNNCNRKESFDYVRCREEYINSWEGTNTCNDDKARKKNVRKKSDGEDTGCVAFVRRKYSDEDDYYVISKVHEESDKTQLLFEPE